MVAAIDQHMATQFSTQPQRGRPGVSTRVLLALELLKAELACSDEQICSRLRTDFAVLYACGVEQVQAHREQAHFVLPEVLAQFRGRLDEQVMAHLLQIQATDAMEKGLVSPAHLVADTFVSEQGSQRVTDATTLYKAKKSPECGRSDRRSVGQNAFKTGGPSAPRPVSRGDAHLWPDLSRPAKSLCQPGASDRKTALNGGRVGRAVGA
jgi:hypothetical protein